ncbi:MAG TPA: efflux RND transporter periplasmic adaptor subunit, partial [Polyangiaceae bacterium]|nr:efflux RND transporter periplasmic adaptor subunit [Polyangiaceae bacterium]
MTTTANEQHEPVAPRRAAAGRASAEQLEAVVALERALRSRRRGRFGKFAAGLALVAAVAAGAYAWQHKTKPAPPPRFVTQAIEVRDISENIESSGKLRPLTEVKVGSQVSGRVVRVLVDFNHLVKKGDLLAEIDPSLFGAQVSQVGGQFRAAQAQLERARAAEAAARSKLARAEGLHAEKIASQADLDQTEEALRIASADVLAASAQLEGLAAQLQSANTTLTYTKIYSPIDGIVIDRAVDPGQTVAASFAAPVLFVIAQDLSAMQVLADIDEADVGKLREGMSAQIRVDAFPERTFAGKVIQIRYNPTEVLGVVTYAAVIDVRNDELALRPGMTATVTVTAESVQGVRAVRNSALRFKPKAPEALAGTLEAQPGQRRVFVLEEAPAPSGDQPRA